VQSLKSDLDECSIESRGGGGGGGGMLSFFESVGGGCIGYGSRRPRVIKQEYHVKVWVRREVNI
jgi:hypothetical protein